MNRPLSMVAAVCRLARGGDLALLASALLLAAGPARADDTVPYWASLHAPDGKDASVAPEVNVRVGPGRDYRIAWVYHRQHLPVKVLREMDGWRLIEDQDHARGWVMVHFVSKTRTAVVVGNVAAESHAAPDPAAHLNWRFLPGVIGNLGACNDGWCKLDVAGRVGFVEQGRLWGASPP